MSYITEIDIINESKDNFLTYASEVLTDRAIPSAEDGLLSAQRKLLWTMEDYLKMNNKSKTKKCNAIVGSTLATSYFHGDSSCYGVLCKLSQDYLMRYPLISGQGSLGTQENNDMVASSRYTEAKPSIYADIMMEDFKKNVVPLKETYNGEFMEPVVLPGLFPNAICNGRQAIGISMSHNSLPHNLSEVCDGIIAYIKNNNLTVDELMTYIKGPDFPLHNIVINKNDIKTAFSTGHSSTSLKVRGVYEVDGRDIIFTSIPYRTYRNKIKEQIEKNIESFEKVFEDFNDESSLGNNRLVFTLKNGVSVQRAVNKLFELTDLQTTISYNMNYIVDGTPKLCSMLSLIKAYVNHQISIILKVAEFDKEKAEKRKHILEGMLIILTNIDKAINIIRNSNDSNAAKLSLMKEFSLDEIQAKAVLDMKLSKLTKMDKDDLIKELEEKKAIIAECDKIINEEVYRNEKLIEKITSLKNKYGDARRTELLQIEEPKGEEKEIINVEPEKCVVVMTESGLIKRVPVSSFKIQKRNGKGVKTVDDITNCIIRTNTIDNLMIFTDKGRMYRILVDNIPVGTNTSKGQYVRTLVEMAPDENPTVMYSIYRDTDAKYVMFVTKKGLIKKTALDEFGSSRRKTGVSAITLTEGDGIASVSLLNEENVILLTKGGMGIQFSSKEVAATGKTARGIKGITLKENDYVVAALPVRNSTDKLAIFNRNGTGKKISLNDILPQKRGGKGLICSKEEIAAATLVEDSDRILIIGKTNSICISAEELPVFNRGTMGNQIIKGTIIEGVSKV